MGKMGIGLSESGKRTLNRTPPSVRQMSVDRPHTMCQRRSIQQMTNILRLLISLSTLPLVWTMHNILVTGANSGIGLALCKQLCKDHGAKVFLGARNPERGAAAVLKVQEFAGSDAAVELLTIDVADERSVQEAAASLQKRDVHLTGIVNNAGTGLAHGVSSETMMDVNLMGAVRVVNAFSPLLDPSASRIVNVGSGSGPYYVSNQNLQDKKQLCNPEIDWEAIKSIYDQHLQQGDSLDDAYGLSKALLNSYSMFLARELASKNVSVYCTTPGYIATAITEGMGGGKKTPEEGTLSIRHCLLEATPEQSGWFFGSDAKRSPPHWMRSPGQPVFDGIIDWSKE